MSRKRPRPRKRRSNNAHDANYTPESPSCKKSRPRPSTPANKRIKVIRPTPAANEITTAASNLASEPEAEKTTTKDLSPTTKLQQDVKVATHHNEQTEITPSSGASDDENSLATHRSEKKNNLKEEPQTPLGVDEKLECDEHFKGSYNMVKQEIRSLSDKVASLKVHLPSVDPGDLLFPFLLGQAVQASSVNNAHCQALLNNWLWRCMAKHCFDPEDGFWSGPISQDFQTYYRKLHKHYEEGNLDEKLFSEVKHTNGRVLEALHTKLKDNLKAGNKDAGSNLGQRWVDPLDRVMANLQALWQTKEEDREEIRDHLTEIIRHSSWLGRIFIMSKAIFEIGSLEPGCRPPVEDPTSTSAKQYIVRAPKLTKRGNTGGDFSCPPKVLQDGSEFEFEVLEPTSEERAQKVTVSPGH